MNKTVKAIIVLLLLVAIFFLGYVRNFIFVTINAQTAAAYYHDTRPAVEGFMHFLASKDYSSLIYLKKVLTLLFFFLFFITSTLTLYFVFREALYVKICLALYGFLLLSAGIIVGLGIIIPSFYLHAYNISRNIMHITQSPFTIVLLLAFSYYHKRAA